MLAGISSTNTHHILEQDFGTHAMTKPSIQSQATAVELIVANTRGSMDVQRDLIRQKKRDDSVLQVMEGYYPNLVAAAETMKWLVKNEELIKKLLHAHRAGEINI